jgi:hypothetical protein
VPAHLDFNSKHPSEAKLPPRQTVDLFAAETAHALAEVVYLLKHQLDPWVTHRIEEELESRIFTPVFERAEHFHWESVTNNWSAVCSGAVGMAALLTVRNVERLAGMTMRTLEAMKSFMEGYGEDGGCPEGTGYWAYGFGYFAYYCEMLHAYTGGSLSLQDWPKAKAISRFPAIVQLTYPYSVNYSDTESFASVPTGLMSRLHERFGQELPEMRHVRSFHDDHCYRWAHVVRDLLWTDVNLLDAPGVQGTFWFPDLQWLVDKRSGRSGECTAFTAKGGHNNEPHNHNDIGHFILHIGGQTLLADLGPGLYTKDYFGEKRYTHLHTSSASHSVPVINGCLQEPGAERKAEGLSWSKDDGILSLSMEMAKAYPHESGILSFRRSFRWEQSADSGNSNLELIDRFEFRQESNGIEEVFISLSEPVLEDNCMTWTAENRSVALRWTKTDAVEPAVERIETVNHSGSPLTVYRVRLINQGLGRNAELHYRFVCRL